MRLGEFGVGRAGHTKEYTTVVASVLVRRQGAEAAPVIFSGDDPQHNLPKTLHRPRSGLTVRVGYPCTLRLRQLSLEIAPLWRQFEETYAAIVRAVLLQDEVLSDQLAEDTAQALLGDAQHCKELADGHLRMPSDKMDDTVGGAAKTVWRQNRVRVCGEMTIRHKQ